MGPTDGSVTYPGWNIDDICLSGEVMDGLTVTPAETFQSSGLVGGPFSPPSKSYTLTNTGPNSLNWTSGVSEPWIDAEPNSGSIGPGDSNTVEIFLDAEANSLPPGSHEGMVRFTNLASGVIKDRYVSLEIINIPGEIDVYDPIPPVNDLDMPFGDAFVGSSRTEKITIANTDPCRSLIISDISMVGRYLEDFNDGQAQSWQEDVDVDWEVVSGEYRANQPSPTETITMVATYGGETFEDFSLEVKVRRDGSSGYARYVLFRATSDFEVFPAQIGSGYAFGIDEEHYFVFKQVSGVFTNLVPWTISSYINPPTQWNTLGVVAAGADLSFYINGHLVNTLGDPDLTSGRIGIIGYTGTTYSPANSHFFDDVSVDKPLITSVTTSPEQQWYNDRPCIEGTPAECPEKCTPAPYPYQVDNPERVLAQSPTSCTSAGFRLGDVGELPVLLAPLGSIDVNVIFSPIAVGCCESVVVIASDDEDEGEIEVRLTGSGIPDLLEVLPQQQLEFAGHPGGPFVPTYHYYQLTNNGPNDIQWRAEVNAPWLDISPAGGTIKPGDSTQAAVGPNMLAESLAEGHYCADVNFTNVTTAAVHTRRMCLEVYTTPKIWVHPVEGCLTATLRQEQSAVEILTIGNTGDANLAFALSSQERDYSPCHDQLAEGLAAEEVVRPRPGHDFTVAADVPFASDELLVRFARRGKGLWPEADEQNTALASLGGGTVSRQYRFVPGLSLVKLPGHLSVGQALAAFNKAPGILYAEPNYERRLDHDCQLLPNDPLFDQLWGMHNTGPSGGTADADIDAPEAWCHRTDASNIIVGVIDTGVDYTHADLAANMWVNEAEFYGSPGVDDDDNGYVDDIYGYDFVNNDGDPWDDHYHGTHCAGTIGGVGDNGEGVAGVCWNVQIMALKFLDASGSGYDSDAIAALEYSMLMGASLTSNSWGGGGYSQALKDAIDNSGDAGMLFVAAAGNDGINTDISPHYPSSYDCNNIISVLASDRYDNKSSWSNYGLTSVDLGAPGSDILSCQPGNGYQYLDGTSMATPHVAGACALAWSVCPALGHLQIKDIIMNGTDGVAAMEGLCVTGGRLNVHNAVVAAEASCSAPWLELLPEAGTISPGQANDVNVIFDAGGLAVGEYYGQILICSNDDSAPTLIVPVMMTVEADILVVSPEEAFESVGITGGPFYPVSRAYTLTNDGNEPLSWTAAASESWLDAEPNGGMLDPGESTMVVVSINAGAWGLDPNTYNASVTFTNTTTVVDHVRLVVLTVSAPDYFTELFDPNGNDMAYHTVTFGPDGSGNFYSVCSKEASGFFTDPAGGTSLVLSDDGYLAVVLAEGKQVSLYGQPYSTFYVGSNGYICFGTGDTAYLETLEAHFKFKRISGLFDDLNPTAGGSISWKQLDDRAVVTFENVPEYNFSNANSFQIEMFFSGRIRITWLDVAARDGLVGLSRGAGVSPYFTESDLSEYRCCDLNDDGICNFFEYAELVSWWGLACEAGNQWCDQTDYVPDGVIDIHDLAKLADRWLRGPGL
ncbi:MAG TPA: S8 family serine peptidase [Sedimentisphaerales bacterium]|nr:S8 family serine peptidase [Sedimentisphaerales bacterium]